MLLFFCTMWCPLSTLRKASMVMFTENVFWYTKTIIFLGKMSKSSSKVLFQFGLFFHGALYCCVRYSHIEYQDEIFKTYCWKYYFFQKVMAKSGFRCQFYDLKYFEVGFFFHISWIHYKLEGTITKIVEKKLNVILVYSNQSLDDFVFNIPTCTLLAPSFIMCRLFLKWFLST